MTECVIHWFRRDLRLRDNLGLEAALRTGVPVIPIFVLDDRILAQPTMGDRRVQFLRTALQDLDDQLMARGSRLVVVHSSDAARELNRLAEEAGAWALFFNRDHTPYARWRDTRATRGMQMTGVVTMPMDDLLLVSPLATAGEEESFPETFEEFSGRWFAALDLEPEGAPPGGSFMAAADLPQGTANWPAMLSPDLPGPSAWPGATPASAEARLAEFVASDLAGYSAPADQNPPSSRLSAALKFGTISVRHVARTAIAHGARHPTTQPATERFIMALARREFAHHLLFHRPDRLRAEVAKPGSAAGLDAWVEGRTGQSAVDAALRQLAADGWIPESSRALAAAFLAEQPGSDWRAGERHFARHLVDLDVACNDLGWQQAAAQAGRLP